MRSVFRSVLAVLAGALAAAVVIGGVEAVSRLLYPPPPGVDFHDPETLRRLGTSLPSSVFLMALAGWALGAFSGAWVAARLAGRAPLGHGLAVGAVLMIGAVANMLTVPHPAWMWVAGIAELALFAYGGGQLALASVSS